MGFIFSLVAVSLSTKAATGKHSYGYHRAEVLGALASVLVILILTFILCYAAVLRVIYPPDNLDPDIMLYTSIFGLFCNLIMFSVLHGNGGGHGPGQSCGHDHGHGSHDHGHGSHDHHHHHHGPEHEHDHEHNDLNDHDEEENGCGGHGKKDCDDKHSHTISKKVDTKNQQKNPHKPAQYKLDKYSEDSPEKVSLLQQPKDFKLDDCDEKDP